MKKLSVVLIAFSLLSGCASMFNGSSQQVSIRSNEPGTEFYVNEMFIGKDSAVTVFKKKKNYMIAARKEGCVDTMIPAQKSFDATSLLGILLDFGIISMIVVDGIGTGAIQQFDQTSYIIDPNC